jgi:hypothetical protein
VHIVDLNLKNMSSEMYEELRKAIAGVGFFTTGSQYMGSWQRICPCSKRNEKGQLTGNSFWVSWLAQRWYLGSWSGNVYILRDNDRIAELCISWLTRKPDRTEWDFDDELKDRFGLIPVTDEEFDGATKTS